MPEPTRNEPSQPQNSSPVVSAPPQKPRLLIAGMVILVLSVAAYSARVLFSSDSSSPTTTQSTTQQATATVTITSTGFSAATIRVQKGTTVQWVNEDGSPHRVVSDPHPTHEGLEGLDSEEPLAKGDTYSYTFETAGTFTYHDELNPLNFLGTVIVD